MVSEELLDGILDEITPRPKWVREVYFEHTLSRQYLLIYVYASHLPEGKSEDILDRLKKSGVEYDYVET